jgi:hypothetical protein
MSNPQHEPTMEEILASIRKIISEDQPSSSQASPPDGEGDVLNLTQEVQDDAGSAAPNGADSPANCDMHHDLRGLSHSEAAPADEDELFSEKARAAAEEAFSAFEPPSAATLEPRSSTAPAGASLEAVFERAVRETFEPVLKKWLAENSATMTSHVKPVIRDWLDEHFPAMLENAVRNELARAARFRNRR